MPIVYLSSYFPNHLKIRRFNGRTWVYWPTPLFLWRYLRFWKHIFYWFFYNVNIMNISLLIHLLMKYEYLYNIEKQRIKLRMKLGGSIQIHLKSSLVGNMVMLEVWNMAGKLIIKIFGIKDMTTLQALNQDYSTSFWVPHGWKGGLVLDTLNMMLERSKH